VAELLSVTGICISTLTERTFVKLKKIFVALAVIVPIVATVDVAGAKGRPDTAPNGDAGSTSEYWTSVRVAAA
jgi:hypothetical protein